MSCQDRCVDVFDCDVKIRGKLKVKENLCVDGSCDEPNWIAGCTNFEDHVSIRKLTAEKQNIIPRIDICNVCAVGRKGDLVFNIDDDRVYVSDGCNWKPLTTGNPIHGNISVGSGPHHTFKSIAKLVKFLKGNFIGNLTVTIAPGEYFDNLDLSYLHSDFSRGVGNPETAAPLPGLTILGDTRYIVSLSYVDGALLNYSNPFIFDPNTFTFSWKYPFGSPYGRVDLQQSAPNTVTVVISAIPASGVAAPPVPLSQPNFTDPLAGIVPGDKIILQGNDGSFNERTIVTVGPNTLTYDGADVPVGNPGSALTFCPNVRIRNNTPSGIACSVRRTGVTMIGLMFAQDIPVGSLATLLVTDHAYLSLQSSLVFDRFPVTESLSVTAGAVVSGWFGNGQNFAHNAVIGTFLVYDTGKISYGHWQSLSQSIFSGAFTQFTDSYSRMDSFLVNNASLFVFHSNLQIQFYLGIMRAVGLGSSLGALTLLQDSALSITATDMLEIETFPLFPGFETIGISLGWASKLDVGPVVNNILSSPLYGGASITSSSSADATGITVSSSEFFYNASSALNINNFDKGILVLNAGKFSNAGQFNIISANPKQAEIGSTFTSPNATESPSDVLQISGSQELVSPYQNQAFIAGAPVTITFNPGKTLSIAPNGAPFKVYRGRTYVFYNLVPQANKIVLAGGANFYQNGLLGSTITFNGLEIGEAVSFTVVSNTQVIVNWSNGATFSLISHMVSEISELRKSINLNTVSKEEKMLLDLSNPVTFWKVLKM